MSRIGKQPVAIPQGVKVQIENGLVRAEGPKGKLSQSLPDGLSAKLENNTLVLTRGGDDRQTRALHGTARALVANMVNGVKAGFERKLDRRDRQAGGDHAARGRQGPARPDGGEAARAA